MEMLSNGYGCIKKCSKALKQSLIDWMLHKFNTLLIRTMSDVPTASTSRASTSTASTSQPSPYSFRLGNKDLTIDIECTTTDESDISSDDESDSLDEESANSNDVNCMYEESDDNMESSSWTSTATTVSIGNKSSSDSEKSILKETNLEGWTSETSAIIEEVTDCQTPPVTPILILVQQPCETEGQMHEVGIETINIEEHTKRLRALEKELEFIEATEWMFRPIDSSIR